MKMLKMCLNWKIVTALAAVGAGIYLVTPHLVAAALPYLFLAICPLSMMLMMWGMQEHGSGNQEQETRESATGLTHEERIARLRVRQTALNNEINALERDASEPARNGTHE
jgi:hypothetical protein